MAFLSEAAVEDMLLDHLSAMGYAIAFDSEIGPDGKAPERDTYGETVLVRRLASAVDKLNPNIPALARTDAVRKVIATERPNLIEENRRIHKLLTEGVDVEFYAEDGTIRGDKVRLIDFDDLDANDWLATGQFSLVENKYNRRPDVVIFVNGLPLGVIELKAPGGENATLTGAYNQLQTYKNQIPSLFRTNAVLVTSDGMTARVGSLTSDQERFMPWRTTDGKTIAAKGQPELNVLIESIFDKRRFLDLIHDFTVFSETPGGLAKIIAGYHQFHAVQHAVIKTMEATAPQGNRKIGVIWHTQGSGKSLLMAFYAGQLARSLTLKNPTIVVVTDRNDLDNQLFATFSGCCDLIRQTPVQADSRDNLQTELSRASGGVIFTTIQKFSPEDGEEKYPLLSDRRNIVVIADEAHRSQYGFKTKFERSTGEISYGFAKYLRDALHEAINQHLDRRYYAATSGELLPALLRLEHHPTGPPGYREHIGWGDMCGVPANPESRLCFSIPGPKRRAGRPPGEPCPPAGGCQSRDASGLMQLGEALEQAVNTTKYMSPRKIAKQLGYSSPDRVLRKLPNLCDALNARRRIEAEATRSQIRTRLERAVLEWPPPTLKRLAREFCKSSSTALRSIEPLLCDQILKSVERGIVSN